MTLIVAGERSGVGKTTVTLALLAYLSHRKERVQSFKVGPDYIDPMFHGYVTGRACHNLDPVLTSEAYIQNCVATHTQSVDYALIEGVMGLHDGASGSSDWASTAHIARLLQLPVLLVLDCSRLSRSIAAIVHGYQSFDPQIQMAGVVLNRVGSDRHLELLKAALAPLQIPILGVLRRHEEIAIPDRHLGLVPTDELTHLNRLFAHLAYLGATCFDWMALRPLLQPARLPLKHSTILPLASQPIRIAVARDRAFNFYYAENLALLQQLGAELVFWSPLSDPQLPAQVQGLYLGGGFPEIFAATLAANLPARLAVKTAIQAGMPTYAECGGLMYLCEQIQTFDNQLLPMVGVLSTTIVMSKRLTLGYRQAIALNSTPALAQGAQTWGHEFHRSKALTPSASPLFQLADYQQQDQGVEGWGKPNVHASYLHLHWGDRPEIPQRFLQHCLAW